ncbi:MAG: tRNA uridine(34) 5-carboxymethylaminomethyl modification radical SAM/GNAT enzyme Elp3 [Nanoarchaeota archaeon]
MIKPQKGEIRKPTKTISGITPVAVMLPPRKCEHGECLYCPSLDVPQSYTPKSPVVLRAKELDYDSYKQVKARLKAFEVMNHPTEKIEIIIMGGTFLEYPKNFQYDFIKGIYDALNSRSPRDDSSKDDSGEPSGEPKSGSLKLAQKLNEKSKHRCVALCVETRPDVCINHIDIMREFGVTRVELGVQIIDDEIYEKVKREHKVKDVIDATRELKNAGFKIGYHIMPGLPGSNPKKDLRLFKKLFSDSNFRPDQLKIYPCQVMPGSGLEKLYWGREYKPYSKEVIQKLLIKMLKVVPRYCRVMRVMREIPPEYLVAGTLRIDLRKDVEEILRKKKSKLKEIRYREIGFAMRDGREINLDLKLHHGRTTTGVASTSHEAPKDFRKKSLLKAKITKYKASEGDEYFLEIINKDTLKGTSDILFGLLRLRIYDGKAIIREVHVYGKSLKLGERGKISQHLGLGKWLMSEAEKIVRKNKIKKLKVISGIGVREYYGKLGYELDGSYVTKSLKF